MKKINAFLVILCLAITNLISAQSLTEKQKEKEKNKVEIYSSDERDNIQMWFHEETKKMGLSENVQNEYDAIISDAVFDMRRLNDKDKGYSNEKIESKLALIVEKTNKKVKPLLTEEQFLNHKKNFEEIVNNAKRKLNN